MKKLDIVVIGTIIKETIQFSDHVLGPVLGSPAAYSALVMAAQGLKVGLVTYAGNDMGKLIDQLSPLDTTGLTPYDFTTSDLLVYRNDGTKYVKYQRTTPDIQFDIIPEEYLSCDFFKICPMNYEVDLKLVKKLHELGKIIFVDLGGFGGATSDVRHSIDKKYGLHVIKTLCTNATIIKASAEDIQSIIPGKTVEEAVGVLSGFGAKNVVVTLGSRGVLYKEGDAEVAYIKSFHAISETDDGQLDYTGAGDSFGGGFMASYHDVKDIRKASIKGNATASLVIQKSGGCTFDRMPNRVAIEKRISDQMGEIL